MQEDREEGADLSDMVSLSVVEPPESVVAPGIIWDFVRGFIDGFFG